MRVVVYAEGPAELVGELATWPAPGEELGSEQRGPAHILAARSLELERGLSAASVQFVKGLRKRNAAEPRGSDFLRKRTLLQLLDWPRHDLRPEFAIVFVDEDDVHTRHREMRKWVEELKHGRPPTVIAVARQEFESWLMTDRDCVKAVLGRPVELTGDPEDLPPKAAKYALQRAIDDPLRTLEVRREICWRCDLDELRSRSRSFRRFLDDLRSS